MKFKKLYIALLCSLLAFGCQSVPESEQGEGSGNVVLSVVTNSNMITHGYETKAASELVYSLTVLDSQSQVVEEFEDYLTVGSLCLPVGEYTFVAASGDDHSDAEIDAPYYYGSKKVVVAGGTTTKVQITAKLDNARISVKYGEKLLDETLFSAVDFSVDEAILSREMAVSGSSIFVDDKVGEVTWKIKVTNVQGTETTLSKTIKGIEPCAHYTLSFDVKSDNTDTSGDVTLTLTVDDVVTVYDDDIEINLEKKDPPVVETVGFTAGEQKVVKDVENRDSQMEVHYEVYAGTREITIRQNNADLVALGVPTVIELTTISSEVKDILNSKGIEWTTPVYEATSPVISFTNYAEASGLGEYEFIVELLDKDAQLVQTLVSFVVLPDMDHLTLSSENGAKYAILYGEWCTLEKPEGLSFQYKKSSETEWTIVPEEDIVVTSEENKLYEAKVSGLAPETTYAFRSYSTAAVYAERELQFTTTPAPEIANLNFEQTSWSGDCWYPNASGGNSYWATGNEGLTAWPVSADSNTQETTDAVSGKAVRMISVPISISLSPVKFAAGNLFVGGYSTNMSNPSASAKLGRPYTGRPLGLKGWYKYTPKNINNDKNGVAGDGYGKPDYCHIYISLEDWGGATSRPASPKVIGYGEFKNNQTVSSYTQFNINIAYFYPTNPTHVVVLATSSHLGERFCGGEGSTLYIDEFELVWE